MVQIKTLNKIDPVIRTVFDGYDVRDDAENPAGILVRSAKCHDMAFNPELRGIARAGAGVNNIPLDRCAAEGIVVFNTPGANANAVKELVFASMMMTSRNLISAIDWCASLAGNPDAAALVEKGKNQFVGPELKGKTMGVIGLGDIGVMVANEAYAIGMNVIGFDPFISVNHAWMLSRAIEHADSLEHLIQNSDFISIHVPLSDKTRGYFGEKQLSQCKPTATLLNFSRAELVDIPAVLSALSENRIARYIVDFPTPEVIGYAEQYLLAVSPFYLLLGLLQIYRSAEQSMGDGRAPFLACMIELVMRIAGTAGLSRVLGYTGICLASPLAWAGAIALLIPVYYRHIGALQKTV